MLTTPKLIGSNVHRLRAKLGLQSEPVFVPVRDTAGHSVDNCFFNVADKVAADGGRTQYGWMIWEEPGRLIEAVFHAVWVANDGALTDITPKKDGEKQIVFIPDPTAVYEKEPVDNVRLALNSDPKLIQDIKLHEGMTKLRAKYNVGGKAEVPHWEARKLFLEVTGKTMEECAAEARSAMPIGRNAPCRCGSGKRFKRCCGKR